MSLERSLLEGLKVQLTLFFGSVQPLWFRPEAEELYFLMLVQGSVLA